MEAEVEVAAQPQVVRPAGAKVMGRASAKVAPSALVKARQRVWVQDSAQQSKGKPKSWWPLTGWRWAAFQRYPGRRA